MVVDWSALFSHYDSQKSGLLTQVELRRMIEEAGLSRVTDAEVRFVMNNIAAFKPTMTSSQLLQWGTQMLKMPQKRLIQYS